MSRKAAINNLSFDEEVRHLNELGIIHGISRQYDLQEATSAYKDIETVMANQLDLVRIKTRLMPIASMKE